MALDIVNPRLITDGRSCPKSGDEWVLWRRVVHFDVQSRLHPGGLQTVKLATKRGKWMVCSGAEEGVTSAKACGQYNVKG
ncbi:MAG: hypothetical protein AAFQ84_13060 [Pseudomonadota bacterium]